MNSADDLIEVLPVSPSNGWMSLFGLCGADGDGRWMPGIVSTAEVAELT